MTFKEQILATLIGVVAGFIFSITMFYLTEWLKRNRREKSIMKNVVKELEFNLAFLEEYKEDIEKLLRQIAANANDVLAAFRSYRLQRTFVQEAFYAGLLYEKLDIEDISQIDTMLTYFTTPTDQLAYKDLDAYNSNNIDQNVALQKFEFMKGEVERYCKLMNKIKEKL